MATRGHRRTGDDLRAWSSSLETSSDPQRQVEEKQESDDGSIGFLSSLSLGGRAPLHAIDDEDNMVVGDIYDASMHAFLSCILK